MVVIVGCIILFFLAGLSWKGKTNLPEPRPDVIVTTAVTKEDVLVKNETAGYAVVTPRDWYLEKSAGSGVTIYPNYDATGKMPPGCKIEISALSNPGRKDLANWFAAYLRSDPTVDVSETSRTTTTVSGAPAIIWRGILNGITTTLAYVATGTAVYEFAPSSSNGASISVGCEGALKTILKNFEFLK